MTITAFQVDNASVLEALPDSSAISSQRHAKPAKWNAYIIFDNRFGAYEHPK
ncbi:predicted protein [Plenodomus lingam JN3]|uniref:Predicted protein n=1 Tax=Leptosphaeria maculans (strain JN3 / isolate v23.1.3 / race Av1-4-5-6-7-8) TaxID=985895 RepID=E5A1U2_LEPMJ|nr:predicted protein [Plenodomus lingam JN3]CBX97659.1 predicted protein [Plenodomus lingam JN3]